MENGKRRACIWLEGYTNESGYLLSHWHALFLMMHFWQVWKLNQAHTQLLKDGVIMPSTHKMYSFVLTPKTRVIRCLLFLHSPVLFSDMKNWLPIFSQSLSLPFSWSTCPWMSFTLGIAGCVCL